MTRFIKYQLIYGATFCVLKKRTEIIDCFITNSAEEILYFIHWFLNLIFYRKNGSRKYRQGTWNKLILRDGRKCRICGVSNEFLTIHHLIFIKNGGSKKGINNLIILCKNCHKNLHNQ